MNEKAEAKTHTISPAPTSESSPAPTEVKADDGEKKKTEKNWLGQGIDTLGDAARKHPFLATAGAAVVGGEVKEHIVDPIGGKIAGGVKKILGRGKDVGEKVLAEQAVEQVNDQVAEEATMNAFGIGSIIKGIAKGFGAPID